MKFRVINGSGGSRSNWQGTVALQGGTGSGPAQGGGSRGDWMLFNPSGAVADRLQSARRRSSAAAGRPRPILLTDAQIDQVAGLISLRERAPIELYATPAVFESLTSTFSVLPEPEPRCGLHWHMVAVAGDQTMASFPVRGHEGLEFAAYDTSIVAPGGAGAGEPGHTIALAVRDRASGRRAVFARGVGAMALSMLGVLEGADCLLVDPGVHTERVAQVALADWMADIAVPRKVLLGGEVGRLARRGIEAGVDGADIEI